MSLAFVKMVTGPVTPGLIVWCRIASRITTELAIPTIKPAAAMEWLIKRIAGTPSNDALLEGL